MSKQTFQTHLLCLDGGGEGWSRRTFKEGMDTFSVKWMLGALWTSARVSVGSQVPHWKYSLGISWDRRSCSFSYWVGWEHWPVHMRTGTDSFPFHALRKKKKRPKQPIQSFFLCSTGFSCLSLASFFPRIPAHLKHRSVCSPSLLCFAPELVDSLELWFIRDQLSKARNVRLSSLDGIWAESVWVLAFVWKC